MDLTERDEMRFKSKVQPREDGCWDWLGSHFKATGYALFNLKMSDGVWRPTTAHRVAHTIYKGPIPDGLHIDHLCRNRRCVNPDHLEAVPQKVNTARGMTPSAIASRTDLCLKGHPLTEKNVYRRPGRPDKRECRTCMKERERLRGDPDLDRDAFYAEGRRCAHDHLLDEGNVIWEANGRYRCKVCHYEAIRRYRAKKRSSA